MKSLLALSLLFSFSAFADFSDEHTGLCVSEKKENCHLALAPIDAVEISSTCQGNLADITCRVMMLRTSDSESMNLICGEAESPLLTQVLEAEVFSYNVAAVVTTASGNSLIINDPKSYHLFSNPAIDVLLAVEEKTKAKMILKLQDRPIELTDVTCN